MGDRELAAGSLFANRFEIRRAAGRGGMGTVYCATDRYSGETVALKLLHAGAGASGVAERFLREAQLLSELRHPAIVAHVAHGQAPDGQRFLAMEWLEGHELGERLRRGPLPVRDCLRLLEQVAGALSVAHERGIIHRDLKPSNLFLVGGDIGRVKLLDFGIARRVTLSQAMTRTGMVVGTPEYMAPEQARGSRDLTPAADLFSLGCVLYECLTGQPPFVAEHIAAVLVRILFEEPVSVAERRPGISPSLAALVARLLAKSPEQRLATAAALQAEIMGLGELPEPALAVTLTSPRPPAESFAEQEQGLFCVVLAAPAAALGQGETQAGSEAPLAATDRRELLQALSALGGSHDFLANGTLVVTVPPLGSAQDQATMAARAGLLIKERWPDAVISMATGRGAARGQTTVGEVVEAAARALKTGTQPAAGRTATGVLLDPLSARLLEGRFAQTPQPGGALLLHEERDVDASRPLLGKPTPCVGREAELSNLEAQLTSCIDESVARALLFTAPPGVGKSRLRHEFVRRVEKRSEPITLLLGRADMMSAGAPYGVLRAALSRLCGISGSEPLATQRQRLRARISQHVAPSEAERVVLFLGELCNIPFPDAGVPLLQAARRDPKIMRDGLRRALLDLLAAECAAAPVVLILDDLQWGDEPTVSTLDDALRELAEAPLFILAFARPEIHEVFPTLWSGHGLQKILLKGLSKKACERLIVQILGKDVAPEAAARAIEQAGGNALFLEELIRTIAEGKSEAPSETVVAMLQARLGRLDSSVRRAVRAASLFGQSFWLAGVASVLGLPAGASEVKGWLSILVDAELVQPHPQSRLANQSEYRFRHALVRDAAYTLLSESDLQLGHRKAGEFLEAAREPNAAVIAEHLERGGEQERAASLYAQAAERSLGQSDPVGALQRAERGLACAPRGELLGRLCSSKVYALLSMGRIEGADEDLEVALRELPAGSLGWCRAVGVACYRAAAVQDLQRIHELMEVLLRSEPRADARSSYMSTLGMFTSRATISAPSSLLARLLKRCSDCVALEAPENPAFRRYEHQFRAAQATYRTPQPWTLVQEGKKAAELFQEVGDQQLAWLTEADSLALGWLELGDHGGVLERLRALEARLLAHQTFHPLISWRRSLGRALAQQPDEPAWAQAEQVVAPLLSNTGPMALFSVFALETLARVALNRRRPEQAVAHAAAVMPWLPVCPILALPAAAAQLEALLALSRTEEAVALAAELLATTSRLEGAGIYEVEVRVAASEAFHAAGRREQAVTELRETLRQIQLRADDITDAGWRLSYLTRNPFCVRAQALARDWELDVAVG